VLERRSGWPGYLTLPIDELSLPTVRVVKIDVEGHELPAVRGMRGLLKRDHPVLIVETGSQDTITLLGSLDYTVERLSRPSNLLCRTKTMWPA